ncbi:MAG: peptidoglycan DD-metalloendopeptidase family protein [Rhodospirillales bacterium]|nr:peptidoglycan DD-metalloendopeptidase family protein [Rhodospirillales bacterium]
MEPAHREGARRDRIRRFVGQLFPERQFFIRTDGRVAHVRLSRRIQVAAALAVIAAGGWVAFSTASYVFHDDVLAAKDIQIANVRLAYRSLLGEVAEYQKKFTAMSGDLEQYHEMMLTLAEQNTALQRNLNSMETQLRSTESERENVLSARENLKGRLGELERDMKGLANRNFALKDNLTSIEQELQSVVAERNQALFEGARMRRQIEGLETRLASLQSTQTDVVQRLTERTVATVEEFAKVVELAGLDVQQLMEEDESLSSNQGGPFINAGDVKPDGVPGDLLQVGLTKLDVHLNQLEGLQTILGKLPLALPMDHFQITSPFGKRRDPLNKRWAMHYGLDLGGVYKTPVQATAPGIVTFAGWKGNYGRLVEIDHGAGIKTRYGHLERTLVKKGQEVKFRDKIGLMGNSGRSTGSHLHYEVSFKGRPKDPMKFIKAGRHVFKE